MADTRRDIIEKVRVLSEQNAALTIGMRSCYTADPAVPGGLKTLVDAFNANVTSVSTLMAAFAAASP